MLTATYRKGVDLSQVSGFTDIAPVVREQTVKAVLTVITKLSDRTINGELLKYLAKTSNDEQPGIRTNTTICLGKIARNLNANVSTTVMNLASQLLTASLSDSAEGPYCCIFAVITRPFRSRKECRSHGIGGHGGYIQ